MAVILAVTGAAASATLQQCILISTLTGGLLAQEAYSSGSLPTALIAMQLRGGLVLFEGARHPEPIGLGLTAVLVSAGVVVLANSPTLPTRPAPGPQLWTSASSSPKIAFFTRRRMTHTTVPRSTPTSIRTPVKMI